MLAAFNLVTSFVSLLRPFCVASVPPTRRRPSPHSADESLSRISISFGRILCVSYAPIINVGRRSRLSGPPSAGGSAVRDDGGDGGFFFLCVF